MRMLRAAIVALVLTTAATCGSGDGEPRPPFCPPSTVTRQLCVQCGAVGGCYKTQLVCAQTCTRSDDCSEDGRVCIDGICQYFCI
jgi:hypothetical protein